MTDLNTFLRRADVEALIDVKLNHINEQIADRQEQVARMKPGLDDRQIAGIGRDVADFLQRRSALATVRAHLAFCEQFVLTHQPDAATPDLLRRQNGQPVEMVRE